MPQLLTDPAEAARRIERFLDMFGTPGKPIEIGRAFDPETGKSDYSAGQAPLLAADVWALLDFYRTATAQSPRPAPTTDPEA